MGIAAGIAHCMSCLNKNPMNIKQMQQCNKPKEAKCLDLSSPGRLRSRTPLPASDVSNFILKPSCQVSCDCQDPFVKELEAAKATHGQLTLFILVHHFHFSQMVLTCLPNISSFQTSTMVLHEATRVAALV